MQKNRPNIDTKPVAILETFQRIPEETLKITKRTHFAVTVKRLYEYRDIFKNRCG